MPHWKTYQDPTDYIQPHEMAGGKNLTISRIESERNPEGKLGMVLYFLDNKGQEYPRKITLAKCVRYSLELLFGSPITEDWIGKEATFYETKCSSFGAIEPCIRVQVPDEIEQKIIKWLKKKKANPKTYKA